MKYDLAIIGGGIVGLATAFCLQKMHPKLRLLLLEKEPTPGRHQTGHNSGVIHSGIYYQPGSLKAEFSKRGGQSMTMFCEEHGIAHEICGKVVVATRGEELPRLDALEKRGRQNGLDVQRLTPAELAEREPHVTGLSALLVNSAGIADYKAVVAKLAMLFQGAGGDLRCETRVEAVREQTDCVELITGHGTYMATKMVTCAGLQSDLVARMCGVKPDAQIIPFRGEYFELKPQARYLVKHLVYPVPNPDFPFLGVHFTRSVEGSVHAGPNAVLALKREGYYKWDFSLRDTLEILSYPGFRRMAAANWREGLREMYRSFSRAAFLDSLQRLVPEIKDEDIEPAPAGVRAQALLPNGKMVDDFLVVPGSRALHVLNAPSPAATASLEIGRYVAGMV